MVPRRVSGNLARKVSLDAQLTSPQVALSNGRHLEREFPQTVTEWHDRFLPGCAMAACWHGAGQDHQRIAFQETISRQTEWVSFFLHGPAGEKSRQMPAEEWQLTAPRLLIQ
jgi:hypothetical protein